MGGRGGEGCGNRLGEKEGSVFWLVPSTLGLGAEGMRHWVLQWDTEKEQAPLH